MKMQNVIEVENLTKKFKITKNKIGDIFLEIIGRKSKINEVFLSNITFTLKDREILGINRSGKTTLLRTISGIYKKDGGKVTFERKITPLINLKSSLNPRLSAKDNVHLISILLGIPNKQIQKTISQVINLAEISEFADTKIYQFSEGMKQRLVFSIVINSKPNIMLIDEAMEDLDEYFKNKVKRTILKLKNRGVSVIIVSHDLELIKEICDRVIWLENGKIKEHGKTKGIVKDYRKSIRIDNKHKNFYTKKNKVNK